MKNIIKAIVDSWGNDTRFPDSPAGNIAAGQCATTALVVQDLLNGDILRAVIPDMGSHYWNRLEHGIEIDLTRGQYSSDLPIPRGIVVPRSYLLEGEKATAAKTYERYQLLKSRIIDKLRK